MEPNTPLGKFHDKTHFPFVSSKSQRISSILPTVWVLRFISFYWGTLTNKTKQNKTQDKEQINQSFVKK